MGANSEGRRAAARTPPAEGDAICEQVLELTRRVIDGAPLGPEREWDGLDPVRPTPESLWLDSLDSATRAGWPGYLSP